MFAAVGGRRQLASEIEKPEPLPRLGVHDVSESHALGPLSAPIDAPFPKKRIAPRKPKHMPASVPGDVQAWFASKTVARPGSEVRSNEVYAACRAWCEGRGETPVSLTKFGMVTKGALGVPYREKSNRGYYCGIEIAPGARLN
jgi:hypothetical protein